MSTTTAHTTTAHTTTAPHTREEVSIIVNKKPVIVSGHSVTGLSILEAAIAYGVEVGLTFQVAEIDGKHRKIIGHDQVVHVKTGSEFVATADDDNS